MNVEINEPWTHDETRRIEFVHMVETGIGRCLAYHAVTNRDVRDLIDAIRGINDPAAAYQP
jgi:hypothetical protein